MRTLFLLLLGALSGAIATVLFFSLDTTFDSDPDDNAGGGNARLVFDERALENMIQRQISELDAFSAVTSTTVHIEQEGVIRVRLAGGASQVGIAADIVVDPNIVDGRLEVEVVQAEVGGLGVPRSIADIIQRELQEALDGIDPGTEYRLVSIATTNRQLTLEVEI